MSLENIVKKASDYAKLQFLPANKGRMADYVSKYDLNKYFSDDIPKEEREKFRKGLEEITYRTMEKYSDELNGVIRKAGSKGAMGLAFLNDLYAYTSKVPFANVTNLGFWLFVGKTGVELPALYRYAKKSGDWYGALYHLALKPIRYLIPVVGAALESGSFERMVKKGIRRKIVKEFVKKYGQYIPIQEKLKAKLKSPLRDNIYIPSRERELVAA